MKFTLNSKNLLQALFIVVIGFLLFNLAFILLALILNGISMVTQDPVQNNDLGYLIFLIVTAHLVLGFVSDKTEHPDQSFVFDDASDVRVGYDRGLDVWSAKLAALWG